MGASVLLSLNTLGNHYPDDIVTYVIEETGEFDTCSVAECERRLCMRLAIHNERLMEDYGYTGDQAQCAIVLNTMGASTEDAVAAVHDEAFLDWMTADLLGSVSVAMMSYIETHGTLDPMALYKEVTA